MFLGKVALVTGGASGIGQAIAKRLSAEGAAVIMIDRDEERGRRALRDMGAGLHAAHFVPADLSEPGQIEEAVEYSLISYGRIDIIINNAAVASQQAIEDITPGEWDWLFNINLRAPVLVVKTALPALKESRGNVLNISSTVGITGSGSTVAYATSKGALITLTKSLAAGLHQFGIRVNCLCPGSVDTPLSRSHLTKQGLSDSEIDKTFQSLKSRGIYITPAQIAEAALYLVSDAASAITGSIVVSDAGAMLL